MTLQQKKALYLQNYRIPATITVVTELNQNTDKTDK